MENLNQHFLNLSCSVTVSRTTSMLCPEEVQPEMGM
jgi:hypothetical protein